MAADPIRAARHASAGQLAQVESLFRALGRDVTIAVQPTERALGGELWRIVVGSGGDVGYGEGFSLAQALADFGQPGAEVE